MSKTRFKSIENVESDDIEYESIDNHLKVIADAAVALRPKSPQGSKTKKRTAKKRVVKKGAARKCATEQHAIAKSPEE